MSMKNSNDTIGNWTRDLPACSAVPEPTAPPRSPMSITVVPLKVVANYSWRAVVDRRKYILWEIVFTCSDDMHTAIRGAEFRWVAGLKFFCWSKTTFFFCLEDGSSRLFKNSALEEHCCVINDKSWALQHHIAGERYYAAEGTIRFFPKSRGEQGH